jgi:hypothetical protein
LRDWECRFFNAPLEEGVQPAATPFEITSYALSTA